MEIRLMFGLCFHLIITVYGGTTTTGATATTQTPKTISTTNSLTTTAPIAMTSTTPTTTPSTTGRYSSGSLTRKPINTAAVAGSSNITLECASSYGTDAISWSFTPFGSFNNETILISNGYQLLDTNQQQYELRATVISSVLIVLQLSNLTEGTYGCYDGVETAKALLLVIPLPISMEPLFGPVVGGTSITIIGSSTIDNLSKYISSYLPKIRDVRNVYIGNDLCSTSVSLLPNGSSAFEVVAVTPNKTEASIGQPLPIIIEFSPTPFNMTFNKAFTYLPNPGLEITGISPSSFTVTGSTILDVSGKSLSSVAKPIVPLTVVITRSAENRSTPSTPSTSTSRNINDDEKSICDSGSKIVSTDKLLEFDPSKDELIHIKGMNFLRGCLPRDYVVHIGNQICNNSTITDNELSCRPPKEKPTSTMNDTLYCDQHLSIMVNIVQKPNYYACLKYTDHSRRFTLIVGLTVGLAGFALLLTILIVCIVRCRRKKRSQNIDRHKNPGEQELKNRRHRNAVRPKSHDNYGEMGHFYN